MSSITCDDCDGDIPTLARYSSGMIHPQHNSYGGDCAWCATFTDEDTYAYCALCSDERLVEVNDINFPVCCACDEQVTQIVIIAKAKYYCVDCASDEVCKE